MVTGVPAVTCTCPSLASGPSYASVYVPGLAGAFGPVSTLTNRRLPVVTVSSSAEHVWLTRSSVWSDALAGLKLGALVVAVTVAGITVSVVTMFHWKLPPCWLEAATPSQSLPLGPLRTAVGLATDWSIGPRTRCQRISPAWSSTSAQS